MKNITRIIVKFKICRLNKKLNDLNIFKLRILDLDRNPSIHIQYEFEVIKWIGSNLKC